MSATDSKQEDRTAKMLALADDIADQGGGLQVFSNGHAFVMAQRMAQAIATSTMIPNQYRTSYEDKGEWVNNPAAVGNCLIALELANRLRVSALMVMQKVDMIHGRPSLRGDLIISLINTCGMFTRLRFRAPDGVDPASDDYWCEAHATDKETGELLVGERITWAMVKAEGWHTKKGSKWLTMPGQMFIYRAASFWSRAHAPDVTMGLYESDEAEDIAVEPPTKRRRARDLPPIDAEVATAHTKEVRDIAQPDVPGGEDGTDDEVRGDTGPADEAPEQAPEEGRQDPETPGDEDASEESGAGQPEPSADMFNLE
jgi:hypothetical protein